MSKIKNVYGIRIINHTKWEALKKIAISHGKERKDLFPIVINLSIPGEKPFDTITYNSVDEFPDHDVPSTKAPKGVNAWFVKYEENNI